MAYYKRNNHFSGSAFAV